MIGQGNPLFGALPHDIKLRHVTTQSYAIGLVKTGCKRIGTGVDAGVT